MFQQPPCLSEESDTSLCLLKGNKAPTLQGAQDSQCLDPNQLQLYAGIRQRREHHRANRGLERQQSALIWREGHGVTACHHTDTILHCVATAPPQHLTDPFWGAAFDTQSCRVPGTWQGLAHAATLASELSLSVSIQESEVRASSPWDTGASRGTSHPHLLPHVPTSAATPGSLAAFPGLSSSGCSAGTQRCNPDHHHCWDRAAPQPSAARPQGAHGVSTHTREGHPLRHPAPPRPCGASGCPSLACAWCTAPAAGAGRCG